MPETPGKEQPRRRQARGERRIAHLLDPAPTLISTTGYTPACTNAI
ncbi:TetR/AcrR family transcriptional regulator, partial [Streptomyces sp. NPDC058964]